MRTKKLTVFCFGILLLLLMGLPVKSTAAVNINVGISIPPPPGFRFHAPPPMVVIPGTYIYAVPDIDIEVLFYRGYWYRPHNERWYRSKSYNGPWIYLEWRRVPRALLDLPPDYYSIISPEYERIPYGHFHSNWGRWERERYWDRDDRWREGRRPPPPHVVHPAPPPPHVVPAPKPHYHPAPPPPPTPAPHYHPAPPPPPTPKPHYHPAPPPKP
jgi:hypothetical protein